MLLQRASRRTQGLFAKFTRKTKPPEVAWWHVSTAAYLVTEVLRGDAEDVQAHGGLLELGLQDLQLEVLLLAALPELLDQSSVQLLGPLGLVGRTATHCTTK